MTWGEVLAMARDQNVRRYAPEFALTGTVMAVSVLGFWDVLVGRADDPQPLHLLHSVTSFAWLGLLMMQLWLIANGKRETHRAAGLSVLVAGPLVIATTALLSVFSAAKGVSSGEGDMLIVQNVLTTIELALFIVMAFVLKAKRRIHAAFLLGTAILFLGIALVFAMTSFFPPFRIEGPDTFHRFQEAAMTGQLICAGLGLAFYLRDRRNGWPYLLAGFAHAFNEGIRWVLDRADLIEPLTVAVGSISPLVAFGLGFILAGLVLAATALPQRRRIPAM